VNFVFFGVAVSGPVFEPVVAAGNGNYLGMMKLPVRDRRSRRYIAEQFSSVFQRSF
jgi:hypothetical protein